MLSGVRLVLDMGVCMYILFLILLPELFFHSELFGAWHATVWLGYDDGFAWNRQQHADALCDVFAENKAR